MSTSLARQDRKRFDPALPAVRKAIDQLEQAIGGREALVDALTIATDPETEYVLGLVADPRNDDRSLSALCDEGNISPGQLLRIYRSAEGARAQVLALREVHKEVPNVARDVMRRSQNHYAICGSCNGSGKIWEITREKGQTISRQQVECSTCNGSGEILSDASLDHQRMALELAGLLAKGGGTSIGIVNQIPQPSGQPSGLLPFAALQLAVQKVLQPPMTAPSASPIIDVDLGDDPES